MVVHACNPSMQGGRGGRIKNNFEDSLGYTVKLCLKNKIK
jgi:hypothetical protein